MGLPWLKNVKFHSSRKYKCKFTPEQCAFRESYWIAPNYSDLHYALPTVYLCVAFIGFVAIANLVARFTNKSRPKNPVWRRIVAVSRYITYKRFRVSVLNWYTPPLGTLLIAAVGLTYFCAMTLGPRPYYWPNTKTVRYGGSPPLSTRVSWLAIACLPFIFVLAAKANMVSAVTGVSYEKLNVFHRYLGYAMFGLSVIHAFPYIRVRIQEGTLEKVWKTSVSYWTGTGSIVSLAWLALASFGPIRNRFYEIFKFLHYCASILFVVFLFIHVEFSLTSWDYFIAAGSLYLSSLLFSTLRTHLVWGHSLRGELSLLPGGVVQVVIPVRSDGAVRSRIPLAYKWTATQHIFVRARGLIRNKKAWHQYFSIWSAHPFTICSLPPVQQDGKFQETPKIRLLITPPPRGNAGFTHHLMNHVSEAVEHGLHIHHKEGNNDDLAKTGTMSVPISLEGPYGGLPIKTFARFDHVVILAGGSGAGFTLPVVEDIFRQIVQQNVTPPKVHLVISTRFEEIKAWYTQEIENIVQQYPNSAQEDWLNVRIHVTSGSHLKTGKRMEDSSHEEKAEYATNAPRGGVDLQAVSRGLSRDASAAKKPNEESEATSGQQSEKPTQLSPSRKNSKTSSDEDNAPVVQDVAIDQTVCGSSYSPSLVDGRTAVATAKGSPNPVNEHPFGRQNFNVIHGAGRPDVRAIIADAADQEGCSVGLAVCGPSSLQYDVANAAAKAQIGILKGGKNRAREVYLHSEAFGW